jgi:hypothetical protein
MDTKTKKKCFRIRIESFQICYVWNVGQQHSFHMIVEKKEIVMNPSLPTIGMYENFLIKVMVYKILKDLIDGPRL